MLLRKRPRAETGEVDLYGLARDTRAEALVARVGLRRGATDPPRQTDASVRAEDADPFRFRSWLFGSVGDVSQRRSKVCASACWRARRRSCAATSAAVAQRTLLPPVPRVPARRRHPRSADAAADGGARGAAEQPGVRRSPAGVGRIAVAEDRAGGDQRPLLRRDRLRVSDALPPRRGHLRLSRLPRRRTIAATRSATAAASRTRRCARWSSKQTATSPPAPVGSISPTAPPSSPARTASRPSRRCTLKFQLPAAGGTVGSEGGSGVTVVAHCGGGASSRRRWSG